MQRAPTDPGGAPGLLVALLAQRARKLPGPAARFFGVSVREKRKLIMRGC
jgi:hypothetical protein